VREEATLPVVTVGAVAPPRWSVVTGMVVCTPPERRYAEAAKSHAPTPAGAVALKVNVAGLAGMVM
jgi:hypothetical protein